MRTLTGESEISNIETLRCDAYNDDPLRVARVANQLGSQSAMNDVASKLQALGHPVRLTILTAIRIEPLCVCELSALLSMSSPALMHHLKILGRAGLIEARKEGKFAVYQPIDGAALSTLSSLLEGRTRVEVA